eukprot:3891912-Lingulodinium_polyedra.AAC.1
MRGISPCEQMPPEPEASRTAGLTQNLHGARDLQTWVRAPNLRGGNTQTALDPKRWVHRSTQRLATKRATRPQPY